MSRDAPQSVPVAAPVPLDTVTGLETLEVRHAHCRPSTDSFELAVRRATDRFELSVPHARASWRAPIWHAFTDGALPAQGPSMGIGGYLVSPSGRITGAFAERRPRGSSYDAEIAALLRLIERARQAGIRRLVCHSDNKTLTVRCQHYLHDLSVSESFSSDALADHLRGFEHLDVAWLPREHNSLADWLSRRALGGAGQVLDDPIQIDDEDRRLAATDRVVFDEGDAADVFEEVWVLNPDVPVSACRLGARLIARQPPPSERMLLAQLRVKRLEYAALGQERKLARTTALETGMEYGMVLAALLEIVAGGQDMEAFIERRIALRQRERDAADAHVRQLEAAGVRDRKSLDLAWAQAIRAERAKSVPVREIGPGLFEAISADGETRYQVDVLRPWCTCADFAQRGPRIQCKHLQAALALQASETSRAPADRAA